MRSSVIVSSLMSVALTSAAATGELGDAKVVQDNPIGPIYKATLLDKDDTELRGSVIGTTTNKGRGVIFDVEFWGFPDEAEYGPFTYHIHVDPVPEDGNCTSTLAHLDPFIRGEDPPCDPDAPATCQVGDLSGKYGKISGVDGGETFEDVYTDLFTSTQEGIGAFFGNRSIVVHDKDSNRLNCGNFELIGLPGDGDEPSYSVPSSSPTPSSTPVYPTPTPSPSPSETPQYPTGAVPGTPSPSSTTPGVPTFTGQASATTFSAGAIMAAFAAMFW